MSSDGPTGCCISDRSLQRKITVRAAVSASYHSVTAMSRVVKFYNLLPPRPQHKHPARCRLVVQPFLIGRFTPTCQTCSSILIYSCRRCTLNTSKNMYTCGSAPVAQCRCTNVSGQQPDSTCTFRANALRQMTQWNYKSAIKIPLQVLPHLRTLFCEMYETWHRRESVMLTVARIPRHHRLDIRN